MSKKLDEIKKDFAWIVREDHWFAKDLQEAVNKAYIAGRDETVDFLVQTVTAVHNGYDWTVEEESILAAKTAKELQP